MNARPLRRRLCLLAAVAALGAGAAVPLRAQDAPASEHPIVRALREDNARLAARLDGPDSYAALAAAAQAEQPALQQQIDAIARQRTQDEARVAELGLSDVVGLALRRQLLELPRVHVLERAARRHEADIARLSALRLDEDEERMALADIDRFVADRIDLIKPPPSPQDRPAVEAALTGLLVERRALLDRLETAGGECLTELLAADRLQAQLLRDRESFGGWLHDRVFWVRSAAPLMQTEWSRAVRAGWYASQWLTSPANWRALLRAVVNDAPASPLGVGATLLAIAALLRLRGAMRRRLDRTAELVSNRATDSFRHTALALLYTLAMAAPWPAMLALVGWRLGLVQEELGFASAVGAGLRGAAGLAFGLAIVHKIGRERGLAEVHLNWPVDMARSLRRNVALLAAIGLPATFVVATLLWFGDERWSDSLGRAAFMLGFLTLSFTTWNMLRSRGRLLPALAELGRGRLWWRLRPLWHPGLVLAPLALVLLAATGYYATALELGRSLLATVWLMLFVAVLHAVLLRWLTLARREIVRAPTADAELDVRRVNAQTRTLLRTAAWAVLAMGLVMIWGEVVPALSVLHGVVLWESARGAITLYELLATTVILVLTVIAGRNVPGLLEIAVLQRLPLDAGAHYAVATLVRYVVVGAGMMLAVSALGVGWSDVQWLVAAVSVGLGFGLQEIFANFVSGLILLLERPIRVGDTVTVAGVSGTVSRIRMRATTVIDWDRKELIVPNKEFITGNLVNWTLSDTLLRVIVKVGVAYGSDTQRVLELLEAIAREHPQVLAAPAPRAVFVLLGDSTLNFELRVFVDSTSTARDISHDLLLAIERRFREAGIDIAFPQLDVHIRSGAVPVAPAPGDQPAG